MLKHNYCRPLLAALSFFTRLPFWRLCALQGGDFKHIVPYWPVAGWLTGGVTAGVLWLAAHCFPPAVAWLLAIASRLLLTGALHEDGLADFADGMGGGRSREQTLAIMKDSHIGSYGVITLLLYFLLLYTLHELPLEQLCPLVIVGDVWSKCVSAHVVNVLPYARKEEESKARTVYDSMKVGELLCSSLVGCLAPCLLLPWSLWPALCVPVVAFAVLTGWMKRRLQGYTGDCCGALFLLSELAFLLCVLAMR